MVRKQFKLEADYIAWGSVADSTGLLSLQSIYCFEFLHCKILH